MDESKLRDWQSRLEARAAIQALEPQRAPSDPDVRAFRERLPGGRDFETEDQAIAWLRQLQAEPAPSPADDSIELQEFLARNDHVEDRFGNLVYLGLLDAQGLRPYVPIWIHLFYGDREGDAPEARYADEGEPLDAGPFPFILARPHGIAGDLYRMGFTLEKRYGWTPSSARAWLLCGTLTPEIHAISQSMVTDEDGRPLRIRLDVHAEIPPHLVMALFSGLQGEHKLRWKRKPRAITSRNAKATLFAIEHNDGRSFAECCEAFNERYPDLAFRRSSVFTKAVRSTYSTLFDEKIEWKRRPDGQ